MHYVVTKNGWVIDGPKPWNHLGFQLTLKDEVNIDFVLPKIEPEARIDVSENVKIYPARYADHPTFDPKFNDLAGPFWTYSENLALGEFQIIDKPLDHIKGILKGIVASNRYNIEVSGTKTDIQGVTVTVDTSRDGRQMFINQLVLMGDTDTVGWKFPEAWLNITKTDMMAAVAAGATHVKSAFEWEASKAAEIDACSTVEELRAIVTDYPVPEVRTVWLNTTAE